jgi:hypothetical protein
MEGGDCRATSCSSGSLSNSDRERGMTVEKTVGPILTEVVGIGVPRVQKMDRYLFKVVSG